MHIFLQFVFIFFCSWWPRCPEVFERGCNVSVSERQASAGFSSLLHCPCCKICMPDQRAVMVCIPTVNQRNFQYCTCTTRGFTDWRCSWVTTDNYFRFGNPQPAILGCCIVFFPLVAWTVKRYTLMLVL
jgi:hypothetical protein